MEKGLINIIIFLSCIVTLSSQIPTGPYDQIYQEIGDFNTPTLNTYFELGRLDEIFFSTDMSLDQYGLTLVTPFIGAPGTIAFPGTGSIEPYLEVYLENTNFITFVHFTGFMY